MWNYERKEIRERLPEAALFESLGEEAAELAHAALKMARKLRGDNPTPVGVEALRVHVREEITDVQLVAEVLGLEPDAMLRAIKLTRWQKRLGLTKSDSADAFQPEKGESH